MECWNVCVHVYSNTIWFDFWSPLSLSGMSKTVSEDHARQLLLQASWGENKGLHLKLTWTLIFLILFLKMAFKYKTPFFFFLINILHVIVWSLRWITSSWWMNTIGIGRRGMRFKDFGNSPSTNLWWWTFFSAWGKFSSVYDL